MRRRGECGKIKPIVNEATFLQLCEHLSDNLWLQGLLVAVGTCFLEDAGRCGVGLLVAAGHMEAWVALIGMVLGGISGDLGLYLTGRYATQFLLSRRWMNADRLTRMKEIFACHAVSRVVPRFFRRRTVAYSVVGIVHTHPVFNNALRGFRWCLLFLWMGAFIGDHILPYLRQPHLSAALIAAVVLVGFLTHRALARRRARTGKE